MSLCQLPFLLLAKNNNVSFEILRVEIQRLPPPLCFPESILRRLQFLKTQMCFYSLTVRLILYSRQVVEIKLLEIRFGVALQYVTELAHGIFICIRCVLRRMPFYNGP